MPDSALVPAQNPQAPHFVIDRPLGVRRKGSGHEVQVSWYPTVVPFTVLTSQWRDVVRRQVHDLDSTITVLPDSAFDMPSAQYGDVDSIIGVRMDNNMPVAKVAWHTSWMLLSQLPEHDLQPRHATTTCHLPQAPPI